MVIEGSAFAETMFGIGWHGICWPLAEIVKFVQLCKLSQSMAFLREWISQSQPTIRPLFGF